jgi:hypothetical protein
MSTRHLLAVLALVAAGCGDDSSPSDLAAQDLASQDLAGRDLASAADLARGPTYPAGPYGNAVGSTIAPLMWEGYDDPAADAIATSKPYGTYSMNDLRLSGRKWGIVHVSSFS